MIEQHQKVTSCNFFNWLALAFLLRYAIAPSSSLSFSSMSNSNVSAFRWSQLFSAFSFSERGEGETDLGEKHIKVPLTDNNKKVTTLAVSHFGHVKILQKEEQEYP